ncbi:MAG: phenylalanine--tRNA ligase subunit alpha [bacterium]|nr:phenylalanine--tRNA ligase subunit alpha [bacterium]
MKNELKNLRAEILEAIEGVSDLSGLEDLRVKYLGRKGTLPNLLKGLKGLADDARKEAGAFANEVKLSVDEAFSALQIDLEAKSRAEAFAEAHIDITRPGITPDIGHLHLTTQAIEEIKTIFSRLGFVQVRHPEIDWDHYAFGALNFPEDHPARDDWETFFIDDAGKAAEGENGKIVLTPHTSNGQVREMERSELPIRMMNINKTYRRQVSARHLPMFHQFEGLLIDKDVSIADLLGTFDFFVKQFFGPERKTRLRPHHFRFTEPSFELDVSCDVCAGTGMRENGLKCKLCKVGWLELGGAGMVHPNVLRAGGIDPDVYSGFAFGWGVERTMMMKGGINIPDIRVMYQNDMRFLEQF